MYTVWSTPEKTSLKCLLNNQELARTDRIDALKSETLPGVTGGVREIERGVSHD